MVGRAGMPLMSDPCQVGERSFTNRSGLREAIGAGAETMSRYTSARTIAATSGSSTTANASTAVPRGECMSVPARMARSLAR